MYTQYGRLAAICRLTSVKLHHREITGTLGPCPHSSLTKEFDRQHNGGWRVDIAIKTVWVWGSNTSSANT